MKNLFLSFFLWHCFLAFQLKAQSTSTIPANFHVFQNYDNEEYKIEADFDKDGKKDLAIVVQSEKADEDYNYVHIFLSKSKTSCQLPIATNQFYDLKFKNGVLVYGACFGNGRYCETYTWRYNAKLATMQLIGYDEESFGNAVHDGAFNKSVNFVTSKMDFHQYHYDDRKQKDVTVTDIKALKLKLQSLTCKNFNAKSLEYLRNIGRKFYKD